MRERAVLELNAPTPALAWWAKAHAAGGLAHGLLPVAAQPAYRSADSAPPGYATLRSPWVTPLFLGCLAALSTVLALFAGDLARAYAPLVGAQADEGATLSVRPFALAFFALLGLFSSGTPALRLRLAAGAALAYAGLTLLVDSALALAAPAGAPAPLSQLGGVVAMVVVLFVGVALIFTQYELPPGVRVATERRRSPAFAAIFVAAVAAAGLAGAAADLYRAELLSVTRAQPVAGLTAIVTVIVVVLQLALFAGGRRRARLRATPGPPPSVAFLVPAHNEEHSIGTTIETLDAAARAYPGVARLYLVDNLSTDRTAERAAAAIAACAALDGEVLTCERRGKAHALNFGLSRTTEEVVVRVDSDTLVAPSLLNDVTPHFADPTVGGVSGIPLPRRDAPRWLRPLWLMEVIHTIGFVRVGQNAIDGAVVLPGSMSVYRGEVVRRLGGFAVGHNGEDGDIAVRIGRLGYRLVTDPRVEFETEVPATLGHLIEQRQRWHRGGLYKTARNKSSIVLRQGLRGMFVLPWAALTACRRSLTLPILVAVIAASLVDASIFSLRELAIIGGTALGANLVLVAALMVVKGYARTLPYLPGYVAFRIFKLYVAFQALLTLELRRGRPLSRSWGSSSPSEARPEAALQPARA